MHTVLKHLLLNHGLSNLTLPIFCPLETVGVALEVVQGLVDFFLGAQDERSVLNDWLVQRLPSDDDCGYTLAI